MRTKVGWKLYETLAYSFLDLSVTCLWPGEARRKYLKICYRWYSMAGNHPIVYAATMNSRFQDIPFKIATYPDL